MMNIGSSVQHWILGCLPGIRTMMLTMASMDRPPKQRLQRRHRHRLQPGAQTTLSLMGNIGITIQQYAEQTTPSLWQLAASLQ